MIAFSPYWMIAVGVLTRGWREQEQVRYEEGKEQMVENWDRKTETLGN